jgi:hypothetical protein
MEIQFVKHGIANNFGDVIELHEGLKEYPELQKALLDHELKHTSNPKFNSTDFAHDMMPTKVKHWQLLKFMVRHPSSLSQFLPIYYSKRWGWVYDANLIIIYSILFSLITIGITIGLFV